jgi:peptide/nickel transport system substrate-binding protein
VAGEVRVAVGEDIWPLTGQGPSSKTFAAGQLSVNVYEPLLTLGSDFTVRPGLAERWEMAGPTTWRFFLRHDVQFHDGRHFTADDVVWSWTGRQFLPASVTSTLVAVTKVDDYTVDFVSSAPDFELPAALVHPEGAIVPNHAANDSMPPVGTGPYKVVEYVPRQRVVVERFDNYWGPKPTVRRLTFLFVPDAQARVAALMSAAVDVAADPPPEAVTALQADKRFHVVESSTGAVQALAINAAPATPGADLAVRRALALALDRPAYVATILRGHGEAGRWLSPSAVLGASAALVDPVAFDPAQARAALDGAGWTLGPDGIRSKGGRRLTLVLVAGPDVSDAATSFVQSGLKNVGIEVGVKKASDIAGYQQLRTAGFDLDLAVSNQNDGEPAFLVSGRAAGPLAPKDLALGDQVAATLTADTADAAQRAAADLTRSLVDIDVVAVPLAGVPRIYAMRRGVDMVDAHPSAINQSWSALVVRS